MGEGGRRRLTQDLHTLDFEGFGHLLTGQLREGGAVVSLVPEFRKIDFSKKLSKTDEGLLMIILGTMEKNVPRRKRSLGYNDTRSELEGYFYMTYRCLPWRKRKHRRRRLPMSSYEFAAAMGYKGRSGRTCKKEDKSRYHNHRRCPTCAITFETADELKQHIIKEQKYEQQNSLWTWITRGTRRHRRLMYGRRTNTRKDNILGLLNVPKFVPCHNCLCTWSGSKKIDCKWPHWCKCTPCDTCKARMENRYRRRLPYAPMDFDNTAFAVDQASQPQETPASAPEDAEPTKPESSESSSESTVASGENPFSG